MLDDWLNRLNVGNTNFETTCRMAGVFIFLVSATMVLMLIFKWGLYGKEEFRNVVPTFIYYIPIPAAIGSLLMVLKPSWFKPKNHDLGE